MKPVLLTLCSLCLVLGFSSGVCAQNAADSAASLKPIVMIGFEKRLSDRAETFMLQNNTDHLVTRVKLKLVYKTPNNEMIDYREVIVDEEIQPHMTKQISVESFDKNNRRYYYIHSTGGSKKSEGYPFKISWTLLRYDIAVTP